MARSTQEIYNQIIDEKETFSSLNGLTPNPESASNLLADLSSGSKVALWRLFAWIVAYAHRILELVWDAFKVEVETLVEQAKVGTLAWWVNEMKLFQLGDSLTIDSRGFAVYDPVTPANRIIVQCAAQTASGFVFLKAAKQGASDLAPLTSGELTQAQAYADDITPAGVQPVVQSFVSDLLTYDIAVIHTGLRAPTDVQADVEAAVDNYIENLPFDGVFVVNQFVDAIQAVAGVVSVFVNEIQIVNAVANTYTYSTATGQDRQRVGTLSGYLRTDTATITLSI